MKSPWILFVVICLYSLPVNSEVYKWVDENGNVHFSDKPHSPQAGSYGVSGRSGDQVDSPSTNHQAQDGKRLPSDPVEALNACQTRVCNLIRKLDPNCTTNDCYRSLKYSESCTNVICRQKKMDLIADLERRLNPELDTASSPPSYDPHKPRQLSEEEKARIIAKCEKDRDYYCDKGAEFILEYERNKGPVPETPMDRLNRHLEKNHLKERYRGNDTHVR